MMSALALPAVVAIAAMRPSDRMPRRVETSALEVCALHTTALEACARTATRLCTATRVPVIVEAIVQDILVVRWGG
jgi:hypothetical protein